MYFYKHKGKQYLDLRGNLILSHNPEIIRARSKNNAVARAQNASYVKDLPNVKFLPKLRVLWRAFRFIFGKSQALDIDAVAKKRGFRNV